MSRVGQVRLLLVVLLMASAAGGAQAPRGRAEQPVAPMLGAQAQRLYLPLIVKSYGTARLQNGGFETGDLTGWRHGGSLPHRILGGSAHGGEYAALLGDPQAPACDAPSGEAWIEQDLTVPAGAGASLSLWYRLFTYDLNRQLADTIDHVDVWLNGERVWRDANQTLENRCGWPPHDLDWKQWQYDVSTYSGRVLTLRVELTSTDRWWNSWVLVDDVEVLEAGPGPSPTATATSGPTPTATLVSSPTSSATATRSPTPSPTPTATIEPGATRLLEPSGITLVYVPGGEFLMGSPDSDLNADADEKPQHVVYVDSFWIGQTEVTNEQYRRFMDAGGYTNGAYWSAAGWVWQWGHVTQPSHWEYLYWTADRQPVVGVSYFEAEAFACWAGGRLPTEAEWEYAARGGPLSRGYTYAGSNDVGEVAWSSENSIGPTHVVGQKRPNELGLYDMSGNVYEWCIDWYDAGYYAASPMTNPQGPLLGEHRVQRGGAWSASSKWARCASRDLHYTYFRDFTCGFRVVLPAP